MGPKMLDDMVPWAAALIAALGAMVLWAFRGPAGHGVARLESHGRSLGLEARATSLQGQWRGHQMVLFPTSPRGAVLRLTDPAIRVALRPPTGKRRVGDVDFDDAFGVSWSSSRPAQLAAAVRQALLAARAYGEVRVHPGYVEVRWRKQPQVIRVVAAAAALAEVVESMTAPVDPVALSARPDEPAKLRLRAFRSVHVPDDHPSLPDLLRSDVPTLRLQAGLKLAHGPTLARLLRKGLVPAPMRERAIRLLDLEAAEQLVARLLKREDFERWALAREVSVGRSSEALALAWVAWWGTARIVDRRDAVDVVVAVVASHLVPGAAAVLAQALVLEPRRGTHQRALETLRAIATPDDLPALRAAQADAPGKVASALGAVAERVLRGTGADTGQLAIVDVGGEPGRVSIAGGASEGGRLSQARRQRE